MRSCCSFAARYRKPFVHCTPYFYPKLIRFACLAQPQFTFVACVTSRIVKVYPLIPFAVGVAGEKSILNAEALHPLIPNVQSATILRL